MEPDQNKGFENRVTKDSKETEEEKVTETIGKADKEEVKEQKIEPIGSLNKSKDLTSKLKRMPAGLSLSSECNDPIPALKALLSTPYFKDCGYNVKELEHSVSGMNKGERIV